MISSFRSATGKLAFLRNDPAPHSPTRANRDEDLMVGPIVHGLPVISEAVDRRIAPYLRCPKLCLVGHTDVG